MNKSSIPVTPDARSAATSSRDKILLAGSLLLAICLLAVVYITLITVTCIDAPGAKGCVHILFIGNSYTSVNDLPGMFTNLARSGGHKVATEAIVPGGGTFADEAGSLATATQIKARPWDFVVLQEQSEIPSVDYSRTHSMYPAARTLLGWIRGAHAAPIFFQTWAHSNGWPENGIPDYESMQAQIDYGYQQIARELNVPIAPAGTAWLTAQRQMPQLRLWQEDGSHPTEAGTYLAACVFYAALFRQSPEGLSYAADLPAETARSLQTIAAKVVLQDSKQWNLP